MKLTKRRVYWIFQGVGWTLYTLMNIWFAAVKYGGDIYSTKPEYLVLFISEGVIFFTITHYYRHLIARLKWLNDGKIQIFYKIVIASVVMGLAVYLFRVVVSNVASVDDPELYKLATILGHTTINTTLLFMWSLFYFVYHYFQRFSASLKYEAALNEIALNQLKSQLNPHFIFNALNGIRALVEDEPAKAKLAINQLSNILRNSLVTDKKRLTSFEDELSTVKDYLGLEGIRYEERLKTIYDIDPKSMKFSIPPLMLQTLVENGIKHGISTLKEGGTIKLTTIVRDSKLHIRIRNSGQYLNGKSRNKGGYGISNTLQRLNLIYGEAASFEIGNENQNTVLTEITLPLNI